MVFRLACGTLALLGAAHAYVWPSPQLDALEAIRFDQVGFNTIGTTLTSFVQPCNLFLFDPTINPNSGRSDAADWIRTAYHDAATHNITDGTGGMDGSIRLAAEQARAENAGNGFSNTMGIVLAVVNRYVSNADAIALGALIAIEACGGPEIAFRGGRVDAAVPNTPGVPVPQQDLDSHIAIFARQGFTQTEMIGLVACGHTFGGVQHSVFPNIVNVLADSTSIDDVAHFDSSPVSFDHNVAAEYIAGTTKNPLVVGFNDTTNSDKRIFGSDGNATMRSFANSPGHFASTCANLFARMLDTVPRGVQLTEVIEPLPVKPASINLVMNGGTLELTGLVRLWNTTQAAAPTVSLLWHDHVGHTGNTTLNFRSTSSSTSGKYSATWYGFNSTVFGNKPLLLDPVAGVTSLGFVVNGVLENQGGLGFAIQDAFMLSQTSCQGGAPLTGRVDVAVRNGVHPTRVYLEQVVTDSVQRISITEIDMTPPLQPIAVNSAYSLWSMNLTDQDMTFTIGAEIHGIKYSTTEPLSFLEFSEAC
ncbi:heme peroxidase [Mycena metata]|uniref:Peroxidase n=1 Tax=Mycena metata TaxID=1033252 RepID=A0AAD7ILL5_9AGAR|nr:heme peroxidase [Mycena metata]KAJ7750513.1 heme peroxidase [Mycena metata]